MEWQFRKTLESFETYKKAYEFKNEIDQGDSNMLKMCLREIEMIIAEPKQKIRPKVLAIRFLRDIMILGREDVIERVQRLIPHILKICSYDLESDDPNRGETFFHEHSSYLKGSKQQCKQIDQLGSTYLILSLESILHWAKWMPLDVTGSMTIYAKAYNDLVQRGVSFPTIFHYYKLSDTQRFKKSCKVQFFTDSYFTSQKQVSNSVLRGSQSSEGNKVQNENQMQVQGQIFQKTSITTIWQMRQFLQQLYSSKQYNNSTNKRLQAINTTLQEIYEKQFDESKFSQNKRLKQVKKWVDKFFVNYTLFDSKKINLKEFLKRVNIEEIQLISMEQQSISILNNAPNVDLNVKMSKSPKKQQLKTSSSSQQLLKRQQQGYKTKTYELQRQIDEKQREIQQVNQLREREKKKLVEDYERRMQNLKKELVVGSSKDRQLVIELQFQNQQLKRKLNILQTQLINTNSTKEKEKELHAQNSRLQAQMSRLKSQNEKLINIISQRNEKEYKAKLQGESSMARNQILVQPSNKNFNQDKVYELEHIISQKDQIIKKMQKVIGKTEDDLQLFKAELNSERTKNDGKTANYAKKIEYLENQNNQLKEALHQANKNIDLKDVEIIELKDDLRRYQAKIKDNTEIKNNLWQESPTTRTQRYPNRLSPDRVDSPWRDPFPHLLTSRKIRFNNYEDLHLELKPVNKEAFLRLCRSSFKKKDILFKQNQLEIGVISETISENKVSFLLHLTNLAEKTIQNIKIGPLLTQESFISTLQYELSLQYIFSIQPQEQQKTYCIIINPEAPFIKDRGVITVSYEKSGVPFSHNIFLPFMITKFLINTKPSKSPTNLRFLKEELMIRYTKKMLPRPSYIKSYFENIVQRIEQKKYEVELYHRDTDLNLYVTFSFGDNETLGIEAIVLREKINQKQRYILEETLSFIEVAFTK